jgi:hypothetical protein
LLIVSVRLRLIVKESFPSIIETEGSELVPDPLPLVVGFGPVPLVPEPFPAVVSNNGFGPVPLVPEPFPFPGITKNLRFSEN